MGLFVGIPFLAFFGLMLFAVTIVGLVVTTEFLPYAILSRDAMLGFVATCGLALFFVGAYLLGQMGAAQGWWGYLN